MIIYTRSIVYFTILRVYDNGVFYLSLQRNYKNETNNCNAESDSGAK